MTPWPRRPKVRATVPSTSRAARGWRSTAWLFVAVLCALSGACDKRSSDGAPAGAPSEGRAGAAHRSLRESVQGSWSLSPDDASIEKMRADLRRTAGGDERKLGEMLAHFTDSMSNLTVELTGDSIVTREDGREVTSQKYDVISESDHELVIKAGRDQETLIFKDDSTVHAKIAGLGGVVLKRR